MVALPSMPAWYKRGGSLFPVNSSNETDICADAQLISATFNRAPLASEVVFSDISNPLAPIEKARRSCPGAMGAQFIDASGVRHIIVSSPPAQNVSPFNSILHMSVDAGWNLSQPNVILGPSGCGFNNIGACPVPGGYVMCVEQQFSGYKAETYSFSTTPDFAVRQPLGALYSQSVDFTGRTCLRYMPDGFVYATSDASTGHCRIARAPAIFDADFTSRFKFATDAFGFLGPDIDVHPPVGASGGIPFYDGNVSYDEWTLSGQHCVYGVYFMSNEVDRGEIHNCLFHGTKAQLFAKFNFPA